MSTSTTTPEQATTPTNRPRNGAFSTAWGLVKKALYGMDDVADSGLAFTEELPSISKTAALAMKAHSGAALANALGDLEEQNKKLASIGLKPVDLASQLLPDPSTIKE